MSRSRTYAQEYEHIKNDMEDRRVKQGKRVPLLHLEIALRVAEQNPRKNWQDAGANAISDQLSLVDNKAAINYASKLLSIEWQKNTSYAGINPQAITDDVSRLHPKIDPRLLNQLFVEISEEVRKQQTRTTPLPPPSMMPLIPTGGGPVAGRTGGIDPIPPFTRPLPEKPTLRDPNILNSDENATVARAERRASRGGLPDSYDMPHLSTSRLEALQEEIERRKKRRDNAWMYGGIGAALVLSLGFVFLALIVAIVAAISFVRDNREITKTNLEVSKLKRNAAAEAREHEESRIKDKIRAENKELTNAYKQELQEYNRAKEAHEQYYRQLEASRTSVTDNSVIDALRQQNALIRQNMMLLQSNLGRGTVGPTVIYGGGYPPPGGGGRGFPGSYAGRGAPSGGAPSGGAPSGGTPSAGAPFGGAFHNRYDRKGGVDAGAGRFAENPADQMRYLLERLDYRNSVLVKEAESNHQITITLPIGETVARSINSHRDSLEAYKTEHATLQRERNQLQSDDSSEVRKQKEAISDQLVRLEEEEQRVVLEWRNLVAVQTSLEAQYGREAESFKQTLDAYEQYKDAVQTYINVEQYPHEPLATFIERQYFMANQVIDFAAEFQEKTLSHYDACLQVQEIGHRVEQTLNAVGSPAYLGALEGEYKAVNERLRSKTVNLAEIALQRAEGRENALRALQEGLHSVDEPVDLHDLLTDVTRDRKIAELDLINQEVELQKALIENKLVFEKRYIQALAIRDQGVHNDVKQKRYSEHAANITLLRETLSQSEVAELTPLQTAANNVLMVNNKWVEANNRLMEVREEILGLQLENTLLHPNDTAYEATNNAHKQRIAALQELVSESEQGVLSAGKERDKALQRFNVVKTELQHTHASHNDLMDMIDAIENATIQYHRRCGEFQAVQWESHQHYYALQEEKLLELADLNRELKNAVPKLPSVDSAAIAEVQTFLEGELTSLDALRDDFENLIAEQIQAFAVLQDEIAVSKEALSVHQKTKDGDDGHLTAADVSQHRAFLKKAATTSRAMKDEIEILQNQRQNIVHKRQEVAKHFAAIGYLSEQIVSEAQSLSADSIDSFNLGAYISAFEINQEAQTAQSILRSYEAADSEINALVSLESSRIALATLVETQRKEKALHELRTAENHETYNSALEHYNAADSALTAIEYLSEPLLAVKAAQLRMENVNRAMQAIQSNGQSVPEMYKEALYRFAMTYKRASDALGRGLVALDEKREQQVQDLAVLIKEGNDRFRLDDAALMLEKEIQHNRRAVTASNTDVIQAISSVSDVGYDRIASIVTKAQEYRKARTGLAQASIVMQQLRFDCDLLAARIKEAADRGDVSSDRLHDMEQSLHEMEEELVADTKKLEIISRAFDEARLDYIAAQAEATTSVTSKKEKAAILEIDAIVTRHAKDCMARVRDVEKHVAQLREAAIPVGIILRRNAIERGTYREQVARLNKKMSEGETLLQQLIDERDAKARDLEGLHVNHARLTVRLDSQQQLLDQQKTELTALERERDASVAKIQEMEREVAAVRGERDRLSADLQDLTRQMAGTTRARGDAENTVQETEAENRRLSDALEKANSRLVTLAAEVDAVDELRQASKVATEALAAERETHQVLLAQMATTLRNRADSGDLTSDEASTVADAASILEGIKALQIQAREARQALEAAREKVTHQEAEVTRQQERIRSLEAEVVSKDRRISALTSKAEHLVGRSDQVASELQIKSEEFTALSEAHATQTATLVEVQAREKATADQLTELQAEHEALMRQEQVAKKEHQSMLAAATQEKKESVEALQKQHAEETTLLQGRLSVAEETARKSQEEYDQVSGEHATLQNQQKQTAAELATLKRQQAALKERVADAEGQLGTARENLAAKEAALTIMQSRVSELETALEEKNANVSDSTNAIERKQEELQALRVQNAALADDITRTQKERDEARANLENAISAQQDTERELATAHAAMEEAEARHKEAIQAREDQYTHELNRVRQDATTQSEAAIEKLETQHVAELESLNQKHTDELQSLSQTVQTLEDALAELRTNHAQLRENYQSRESTLSGLQSQLEAQTAEIALKDALLSAKVNELSTLQSEFDLYKKTHQQADETFTVVSSEVEAARRDVAKKEELSRAVQVENDGLRQTVAEFTAINQSQSSELDDLNLRLENVTAQKVNAESELRIAEAALRESQGEVEEQAALIARQLETIAETSEALETAKEEARLAQENLTISQEEARQAKATTNNIESELETVRKERDRLTEQVAEKTTNVTTQTLEATQLAIQVKELQDELNVVRSEASAARGEIVTIREASQERVATVEAALAVAQQKLERLIERTDLDNSSARHEEEKSRDIQQVVDEVTRELIALRESQITHEVEVDAQSQKVTAAEATAQRLEGVIQSQQATIVELNKRFIVLEDQRLALEKAQLRFTETTKELAHSRARIVTLNASLEEVRARAIAAEAEIKTVRTEMDNALQAQETAYNEAKTQAAQQHRQAVAALQERLSGQEEAIKASATEVQDAKAEAIRLQMQLTAANKKLTIAQGAQDLALAEAATERAKVATAEELNRRLQTANAELEHQVNSITEENKVLRQSHEAQLAQYREKSTKLQSLIANKEVALTDKQSQIDALTQSGEAQKKAIANAINARDVIKAELTTLEATYNQLIARNSAQVVLTNRLQEEHKAAFAKAKAEYDTRVAQLEAEMQQELAQKQATIATNAKALEEARAQHLALEVSLASAKEQVSQLSANLDTVQSEQTKKARILATQEEALAANTARMEALEAELTVAISERDEAKSASEVADKEAKEAVKHALAAEREKNTTAASNIQLLADLEKARNATAIATEAHRALEQQIQTIGDEKAQLETALERNNVEVSEAKQAMQEARDSLQVAQAEKAKDATKIATLEADLLASQNKRAQAEAEAKQLKSTLQMLKSKARAIQKKSKVRATEIQELTAKVVTLSRDQEESLVATEEAAREYTQLQANADKAQLKHEDKLVLLDRANTRLEALEAENQTLKDANATLTQENEALKAENARLSQLLAELERQLAESTKENQVLAAECDLANGRAADIEARFKDEMTAERVAALLSDAFVRLEETKKEMHTLMTQYEPEQLAEAVENILSGKKVPEHAVKRIIALALNSDEGRRLQRETTGRITPEDINSEVLRAMHGAEGDVIHVAQVIKKVAMKEFNKEINAIQDLMVQLEPILAAMQARTVAGLSSEIQNLTSVRDDLSDAIEALRAEISELSELRDVEETSMQLMADMSKQIAARAEPAQSAKKEKSRAEFDHVVKDEFTLVENASQDQLLFMAYRVLEPLAGVSDNPETLKNTLRQAFLQVYNTVATISDPLEKLETLQERLQEAITAKLPKDVNYSTLGRGAAHFDHPVILMIMDFLPHDSGINAEDLEGLIERNGAFQALQNSTVEKGHYIEEISTNVQRIREAHHLRIINRQAEYNAAMEAAGRETDNDRDEALDETAELNVSRESVSTTNTAVDEQAALEALKAEKMIRIQIDAFNAASPDKPTAAELAQTPQVQNVVKRTGLASAGLGNDTSSESSLESATLESATVLDEQAAAEAKMRADLQALREQLKHKDPSEGAATIGGESSVIRTGRDTGQGDAKGRR